MKQHSILVIDQQAYWREFAAETLCTAGYVAAAIGSYTEALLRQKDFALVLLGCSSVEREERLLIMRLLARQRPVIVLATSLPTRTMRTLFIKGVEDAGDKTYDAADLVNIVEQALERIAYRKSFQYPVEKEMHYE